MTGWWFGTWRLWLSIYWEFHHPNWRTHIFQRDSNHQPAMIVIHGPLVTCILVVLFVIVLEVRRKNVILTVTRDSYGLMDLGNVATYSLKQIDTYPPQSRSNMIKLFYGIFWYSLVYSSIYKATKIMFRGPHLVWTTQGWWREDPNLSGFDRCRGSARPCNRHPSAVSARARLRGVFKIPKCDAI